MTGHDHGQGITGHGPTDGPGRATFTVEDGDFGGVDYAEVNECWDDTFGLTFLHWYDSREGGSFFEIGDQALCAIPDEMWAGLPDLDDAGLAEIRFDLGVLLEEGIPLEASGIIDDIRIFHGGL